MKILQPGLALLLTFCLAPLAHSEPAKSSTPANPNKAAQKLIDKLIASKKFVTFPRAIDRSGIQEKEYWCVFKGENYNQPQGAFGSDEVELHSDLRGNGMPGFMMNADIDYRVLDDNVRFLSRQQCIAKANEIKKLLWPNIEFKSGLALEPIISEDKFSLTCIWFYFEPNQMMRRSVFANIRKIDGKCTTINGEESPWTRPYGEKIKAVSYKKALETAQKLLQTKPQYRSAKLASWTIDITRGTYYQFRFGLPAQSKAKTLNVFVNADNGGATFALPQPPQNTDDEGNVIPIRGVDKQAIANRPIETYDSAWTKQGLVFVSNGFEQQFDGENIEYNARLMLRDRNGKCSVLFAVRRLTSNIQFAAPWSDWITIATGAGDFAINVATGRIQQLASQQTETSIVDFKRASVGQSGELAIFRGSSRMFAQSPLLPPTPANVRELNWEGEQNLFFSPDGRTAYTYSWPARIERLDTYGTSIRKLASSKLLETGSKKPRQIENEAVEVHRTRHRVAGLQFYTDGQHLLMNTWKQEVVILDLKTKKETLISPQTILKKNVARLSELNIIDAGLRPGELTILATTKQGSRLAFNCKLDGSGLTLLIPEKAQPTKFYRFASGRTGFNVSKDIAILQGHSF